MSGGGPALFQCPTCQRSFEETGYCPYDRSPLASIVAAGQPTQMSMAMPQQRSAEILAQLSKQQPAQPSQPPPPATIDPHKTNVEPHRTFPHAGGAAAPKTTPAPNTAEITNARAPVPQPKPPQAQAPRPRSDSLKAVSASENPQQVLDAVRNVRESEYDRLVGQTLDGRYYVERKIGEGGMGVVFSARHAVIERPLAIKVLKREVMRDTATIRRFVQEAKAASRIGHPNIVDVTDFGTTPDGMTYSVMEYIAGNTLGTAIRAGAPFAVQRVMRVAAQIARALGAAHEKGIVHRDLKPENVFLLDRDGRIDFVKIVDFGIAKVAPVEGQEAGPRLTRAGSVFGTPEYMAPEQAAGRSDTDGRVDIYALGVIMYEMLVARVPHKGDTMVRTLAMQMLDPVEPPTRLRPDLGIPPELEAVVLMALAKKREQRYQTMAELLAALERVQRESLPPPVGVSVTGSPVYSLSPLPPGADAGVMPVLPPAPLDSASMSGENIARQLAAVAGQQPVTQGPPSRSKAPTNEVLPANRRPKNPTNQPVTTRPKNEPQFVTSEKPITFEHLQNDSDAYPPAPKRRRWPLLLVLGLLVGGATGGVLFAINRKGDQVAALDAPKDAPPKVAMVDAQAMTQQPGPDATEAPPPVDAAVVVVPPHDASDLVVLTDAYVRPHPHAPDARPTGPITQPDPMTHKGFTQVRVTTNVDTARLFVGSSYRGPNNGTIEEQLGTKVVVECRHAGYKSGFVTVVFDGRTDSVVCQLTRIKTCVGAGSGVGPLKNPFDQCPEDGGAAP